MSSVQVAVKGPYITVRSPFAMKDLCRQIPQGRWEPEAKVWQYPADKLTAKSIREVFHGFAVEWDPEAERLVFDELLMAKVKAHTDAAGLPPIPKTKTEAWGHQKQAFWFAFHKPAAALAMDMGTGKSKVAVDLCVNRNHRRVLIACPLSVVEEWPRQFARHAAEPYTVLALTRGPAVVAKAHRAAMAVKRAEIEGKSIAVVINYDSLWRDPFGEWAMDADFDCVILDEIHRIKSAGGKASMYCSRLGDVVEYRLGLSGTPMPHSPLDVYGQFRFLDKSIYGTNFMRFKHAYAITQPIGHVRGAEQVVGYRNLNDLHRRFYSIAFRVGKEVLDLPEFHHIEKICRLSDKATRLYKDVEDELIAEVGQGVVTAKNALVKLLRLQQITSGFVPVEYETEDEGKVDTRLVTEAVDDAKESLLEDLLEDMEPDEPVVVFCRFRRDLDAVSRVAAKLERKYAELSGRANHLTSWQEGESTILGVQIQSGGVGINLTRSRYAIYYSMGYSLGDYEQSLARIHRPGQTRPTTYFHLIAEGTVDEEVYKALRARKNVVEAVLQGLVEGGDVATQEELPL